MTPAEARLGAQLRQAGEAGRDADMPPGSVYLYGLAAVYLGADEDNTDHERKLEELFHDQAEEEGVDPDEVLTFLAMVQD